MRRYFPPLWGLLLALLLGLLPAPRAQAAFELQASVDRNTLELRQSVELLVQSIGDTLPAGTPDVRPLERNFQVLSQALSTRQFYQNGVRRAQRSWRYRLEPRRSGVLQIPGLRVDGKSTAPLRVTVREPAAAQPTQQTTQQTAQQT